MKGFEDYLIGNGNKCEIVLKPCTLTVELYGKYLYITNGNSITSHHVDGWDTIEEIFEDYMEDNHNSEVRFCEECGKPFDAGYMAGDGDWYCCEKCFEQVMNRDYGKDKWRPSVQEGKYGGWYEALNDCDEWEDTSIYWTEWD